MPHLKSKGAKAQNVISCASGKLNKAADGRVAQEGEGCVSNQPPFLGGVTI